MTILPVRVRRLARFVRRRVLRQRPPTRIPNPRFTPTDPTLTQTLLISCPPGFNQTFPSAAGLIMNGFAAGWAAACGPAHLVPTSQIVREIDRHDRPAVLLTEWDFDWLSNRDVDRLRAARPFVWVGIHPRRLAEYSRRSTIPIVDLPNAYAKVVRVEPRFVWNALGSAGREWYEGWEEDGLRWETIYPAADLTRYYPDPAPDRFGEVTIGYVGGYWREKARAFDAYFRPLGDRFTPFGYDAWPYGTYGGRLDDASERQVYTSAQIIPLVTSPAGWLMAEITERYLKAPACRAFCIADQNPAIPDLFTPDELIQAESADHFQSLVADALAGRIDTESWRERGYQAVLSRHTYQHRARQIRDALTHRP